MPRTIEVVYEDNVLKPLTPVEGLHEHERVVVILCHRTAVSVTQLMEGLRQLFGTLTHEEAEAMRKLTDEEFETNERDW